MTNEQRIRDEISTIEGLADYLVIYDDYYGKFSTSECERCDKKDKNDKNEIEWLKEKKKKKW